MRKCFFFFILSILLSGNVAHAYIINGINYHNLDRTSVQVEPGGTYVGDISIPSSIDSAGISCSVVSFSTDAFVNCTGLTSIFIPKTVAFWGTTPFVGCKSLNSITVDEANSIFSSQDGVVFNKSKTILIKYPTGRNGVYVIPDYVKTIGESAFRGCINLTSVTIPDSVIGIEGYAFESCTRLIYVIIPKSILGVGSTAFYYSGLKYVFSLGETPPNQGYSIFSGQPLMYVPTKYKSIDTIRWDGSIGRQKYWTSYSNYASKHVIKMVSGDDLSTVVSEYICDRPLTYKWSPSTSFNCDTLAKPRFLSTTNTQIAVEISTKEYGIVATDSMEIIPMPFAVEAGLDKAIACGGGVQLDNVKTNFSNSSNFKYKWTPSVGLSCDTIVNPMVRIAESATYQVVVTMPDGRSATDTVRVNVNPLSLFHEVKTTILDESFNGRISMPAGWASVSSIYGGSATLSWLSPSSNQLNVYANSTASSKGYTISLPSSGISSKTTVEFDWLLSSATITEKNAFGLMLDDQTSNTSIKSTLLGLYLCGDDKKFHCIIPSKDTLVFKSNGIFNKAGADMNATNQLNEETRMDFPYELGVWYRISAKLDFENHIVSELKISKKSDNSSIIIKDLPFISSRASNFSKLSVVNMYNTNIGKGSNVAFSTSFDNVKISKVEKSYIKPTISEVCGSIVMLDSISTNYNGDGRLSYKWTPSVGLSNDTVSNPLITVTENLKYTVSVSTSDGCTVIDSVQVNVLPLVANAGVDQEFACGSTFQLGVVTNYSGSVTLKYKWTPALGLSNDTINNPVANAFSPIEYSVLVTTPNGCTAIDNIKVKPSISMGQQIRLVSVDGNNKNVIVWNNLNNSAADSVYIYKESNVADSFKRIGAVAYSRTQFTDTLSNPNQNSNRYRITFKDKCGFETPPSEPHKTMHLTINQGQSNSWNLIWEPYVGFAVPTYTIFRGTSPSNIALLSSISGYTSQFSDYNPPLGFVYYQVEVVAPSTQLNCAPSILRGQNEVNATNLTSRSNIATNNLSALLDIDNKYFNIYPNPAKDEVIVSVMQTTLSSISIYNILGVLVTNQTLTSETNYIDISNLQDNVYIVEVRSGNKVGRQKLVVHN